MRIHWFSPLPTAHTDIADFTRRLLPALCARAEVTLWTNQELWSYRLKYLAETRRFDPRALPAELREGTVFYNIGNHSQFHGAIWEAARQVPGFAIMHDVFMHDSIAHSYQVRHDRLGYLEAMQSLYGPRGRRDGEFYWDGGLSMPQMGRRYTCAPYILDNGLGAIVHSRMAARTLRREVDLPVFELPLPFPARRQPSSRLRASASCFSELKQVGRGDAETRRTPNRGQTPPCRLIVFGYLGSNRCLDQVLDAMASLEHGLFRLDIYGKLEEPAPVAARIEQLGLGDLVTVHGFVPGRELEQALDAAHLAINLRFPTKGEASGSQLRIWSHALPSLVSRIGWYAELPEDTAVFVRPEHMVEDLAGHLARYAAAPEPYIQAGLAGYRHLVERHSPAAYAAAIAALARHAGEYRDRWLASLLADRAAEALAGWFDPTGLPGYTGHVGRAILPPVTAT